MSRLSGVLSIVLPIVVALALGYLSKRKRIVDDRAIAGLKELVMRFMLPAVLLGAFYKTAFSSAMVVIALCLFGCCLLGGGIGMLVGRAYPGGGRMLPFLTTGFEAGMMGYGLYAMLFPAAEAHNFAIVDLGQVVFVFTVYMALLNRQKNISASQTFAEMFTSPVFLAIAAGVILSASGLGLWLQGSAAGAPIDAVLAYISAPTGVLMIFVVGYQLEWSRESLWAALGTAALRSAIMAILCACCIGVLRLIMPIEAPLFWAIVLMFSLPAPFVLPIFSGDEAQAGYIATSLSVGTLLSIGYFIVISILQ